MAPSTHIQKFLNAQTFLSGYGFRPHADVFESTLQGGKNKSETNLITCVRETRIFLNPMT